MSTMFLSDNLKGPDPRGRRGVDARRAFTIVEMLVVIGILGLLAAILLPAMSAGRHAAHDVKCRADLRAVAMEFAQFADESGAALRNSPSTWGDRFRLETFQERIYGINDFWTGGESERQQISPHDQVMMCPEGPSYLERRSGMPCSAGAIGPQKNVSIGFNRRLHKRSPPASGGPPIEYNAYLSSKILTFPDVPLAFDVAGDVAAGAEILPYYSAPPVVNKDGVDTYWGGTFWFPSFRHRGRTNIAFIGGHVLSSANPIAEPWTRWEYQPD